MEADLLHPGDEGLQLAGVGDAGLQDLLALPGQGLDLLEAVLHHLDLVQDPLGAALLLRGNLHELIGNGLTFLG